MEIKVSDLRIHNLLEDTEGRLCKVFGIELLIDDCKIYAIEGGLTSLPFYPIEISKYSLLKIGFVENGDTGQFHYKDQIVSFGGIDDANFWIMGTSYGKRVKYIHTLQNLYYSIVEEEIELEL